MRLSLSWRVILAVLVTLIGLLYLLPSIPAVRDSALGEYLPARKINLGLDLQGGIQLTLQVDLEKAETISLAQTGREIKSQAQSTKIPVLSPTIKGQQLRLILTNPQQTSELDKMLVDYFGNLKIDKTADLPDGKKEYTLSYTPEYLKELNRMTVDQAVQTISDRIDKFGVIEPDIRRQSGGRLQVQLPGLQNMEDAVSLISQTAHLEFKLVDEKIPPDKLEKGLLPPGRVKMELEGHPLALHQDVIMTGEYITDARVSYDQMENSYIVNFALNNRGATIFEKITGDNIGKRLAIILDGKIRSAPVIKNKIPGGRGMISGQGTLAEARNLAIVLRSGALPAPVSIIEQRTVGPSLGQESIDKGILSALVGGALVFIFVLIYYGFAGLVANIALTLNIILLLAGLSIFGATLTMPGIAGIILTIGMAVDANVLIFERIREELRRGRTNKEAIREGFRLASFTILDSNLTTIIVAMVLYEFGTGPIRGFAVTLTLGILASLYTAIFVSRIFFDWWVKVRPVEAKLSI